MRDNFIGAYFVPAFKCLCSIYEHPMDDELQDHVCELDEFLKVSETPL